MNSVEDGSGVGSEPFVAATADRPGPTMTAAEVLGGLGGLVFMVAFVLGMAWLLSYVPVAAGPASWVLDTAWSVLDWSFTTLGRVVATLFLAMFLFGPTHQKVRIFPVFALLTYFLWTTSLDPSTTAFRARTPSSSGKNPFLEYEEKRIRDQGTEVEVRKLLGQ